MLQDMSEMPLSGVESFNASLLRRFRCTHANEKLELQTLEPHEAADERLMERRLNVMRSHALIISMLECYVAGEARHSALCNC